MAAGANMLLLFLLLHLPTRQHLGYRVPSSNQTGPSQSRLRGKKEQEKLLKSYTYYLYVNVYVVLPFFRFSSVVVVHTHPRAINKHKWDQPDGAFRFHQATRTVGGEGEF